MVKILVFDTETTDIAPIYNLEINYLERSKISIGLNSTDWNTANYYWNNWIDKWPHIIQLSYIVYDTEYPKKSKIFNEYINLENGVEINNKASKLTHIYKSQEDVVNKCIDTKSQQIYILDKLAVLSIKDIINHFILDFYNSD